MIKQILFTLFCTASILSAAQGTSVGGYIWTLDATGNYPSWQPPTNIQVSASGFNVKSTNTFQVYSNGVILFNVDAGGVDITNTAGTNLLGHTVFSQSVNITNASTTNSILGSSVVLSTNTSLEMPEYIDLSMSGFALGAGGSAPVFTTITNKQTGYLGFDTSPDILYGNIQLPHNIAQTNALFTNLVIVPHIHWCTPVNQGVGSNVQWRIAWSYTPVNSTNTLSGTNAVEVSLTGAQTNAGYHIITELTRITNNVASISDDFRFRIDRIAAALGQEAAGRICLMYFDLHVPVANKTLIGSRKEIQQ